MFFKNFKYVITARKNKHFLQCFGVVGSFSITSHFQGSWHCCHHVRWAVFPPRSQCLAHSRWSVHGNGGSEWNYEFRGEKELRRFWRRDQLHCGHRASGSTSTEGVCRVELG